MSTVYPECRDGSYTINALRYDLGVVCACIMVCIVACFIGFWGRVFFGGSASRHDTTIQHRSQTQVSGSGTWPKLLPLLSFTVTASGP